jgi:hypothetical protein
MTATAGAEDPFTANYIDMYLPWSKQVAALSKANGLAYREGDGAASLGAGRRRTPRNLVGAKV